jgi:DNA repair protein RecO
MDELASSTQGFGKVFPCGHCLPFILYFYGRRSRMPDRHQSYDALFLRSRDSPAGDRIVSILTAEDGILDAFVFGGARSSLRASASPFVFAKTFIYEDPVKHYRKLEDMTILESFSGLRESYAKLWSASVITELIVRTSGCGGEYEKVMDLALQTLRLLEKGKDESSETILLAFLWKILEVMGLQPDLDRCAYCGREINDESIEGMRDSGLFYSAQHEGFVCGSCGGDSVALEKDEILCLKTFSRQRLAECAGLGLK